MPRSHLDYLPMETARLADQPVVARAGFRLYPVPPPAPLTSLLGREREIAAISTMIRREDVRLLTLTGPGGVGKTRLAIAVIDDGQRDFPDGIAFVALAPVRHPDLVAATVAQAIGVSEIGDRPIQAALLNALAGAEMLLVLDNFEHVDAASPLVADLLRACPRLTVLVTSRARLRISGEREYPVPPLSLPAAGAAMRMNVAAAPAVRLFVERAAAVDPGFTLTDENAAAVAAICARLDGLPLAIELAAARGKVLSPALLLPRLARRLPLLSGGPRDVPARLKTMHDAILWSHDLLAPDEQVLFRRIAVFSGGFDLDAAEAVCQGMRQAEYGEGDVPSVFDGIASLVDKSLLQWTMGRERGQRLGMLETIREFAVERLAAAGEEEAAHAAHVAYFAAFDERLDPNRVEPGERVDDRLWRIEADYANFRTALTRMAAVGDAEGVLRLAGALAIYWHHRGNLAEGRRWLEWALANSGAGPTTYRAQALVGLSLILWSQGHHEPATALAQDARAIAEGIGARDLEAFSVHMLGLAAMIRGQWESAAEHMDEALGVWREVGLTSDEAMALRALSRIAYETGDLDTCRRRAEDSLAMYRVLGHPSGAAGALALLAQVALARGDDRGAVLAYQEALHLWSETNARWMSTAGHTGAGTTPVFPRWAGVDDRKLLFQALSNLAHVAAGHAQLEHAAQLVGAVDLLATDAGLPVYPSVSDSHTRTVLAISAALGDVAFAHHHAAGQRFRLDEAVALAMTISVTPRANDRAHAEPRSPHGAGALTTREREVLRLLVAGRPTVRSPRHCSSATAPPRITSPTSSPSWASPIAPRRQPSRFATVSRRATPVRHCTDYGAQNPYPIPVISGMRTAAPIGMLRVSRRPNQDYPGRVTRQGQKERSRAMQQVMYAMRFTGRAEPVGEAGNVLRARTRAPSSVLTAVVGPDGVSGALAPVPGAEATFESEVTFTGETTFQESRTIAFGEGHWLHFTTVGNGHLAPSADPTRKQGAVSWRVDGGDGQFAGASGLITSNFFVDETLSVVDHHFGVLVLP